MAGAKQTIGSTSKEVTVTTAGAKELLDVGIYDSGGTVVNPATATNQDTIIQYLEGLDGAPTNGQVVLTNANTWYQVPQSGSVPTVDYTLIISKETAVGTVRFGFSNNSTPSTTNGNQFSNNDFVVQLAANEVMYFGSSSAADSVNWTAKGSI